MLACISRASLPCVTQEILRVFFESRTLKRAHMIFRPHRKSFSLFRHLILFSFCRFDCAANFFEQGEGLRRNSSVLVYLYVKCRNISATDRLPYLCDHRVGGISRWRDRRVCLEMAPVTVDDRGDLSLQSGLWATRKLSSPAHRKESETINHLRAEIILAGEDFVKIAYLWQCPAVVSD